MGFRVTCTTSEHDGLWLSTIGSSPRSTNEPHACARYVDFLGSRNSSTVDFALKVIKDMLKAGRLDPGGVVDRLTPAFHARTKGTLKQSLSVLDLAVRNSGEPALKTRAVLVAAEGLVHEAADVQTAILDFVECHGDPGEKPLHDLLAARLDLIAVSLRGRLEAWLELDKAQTGESSVDDPAELIGRAGAIDTRLARLAEIPEALAALRSERSDLPALTFDGTEIPRLDPTRRLEPIDDLDTLIELCSRLVENPARNSTMWTVVLMRSLACATGARSTSTSGQPRSKPDCDSDWPNSTACRTIRWAHSRSWSEAGSPARFRARLRSTGPGL